MTQPQRLILLDLDGVILMPVLSRWGPLPIPNGAQQVKFPGLNNGRTLVRGYILPEVISGLRELSAAGVVVQFNTSWLVAPQQLAHAAAVMALDFVVTPEVVVEGFPPQNLNIPYESADVIWHWKWRVATAALDNGSDVVILDDQLGTSHLRVAPPKLGIIAPHPYHGLLPGDLRALRDWAAGGPVPRRFAD